MQRLLLNSSQQRSPLFAFGEDFQQIVASFTDNGTILLCCIASPGFLKYIQALV